MTDINLKSINLPSLSIYNNTIGFYNKYIRHSSTKPVSKELIINNVIQDIDGICNVITDRVKNKDIYEVHFIKPNAKYFVDISLDYKEIINEYDESNNISYKIFTDLDCKIIDLRNTQYQYFIHKIENDYYLLEFCINFMVYTLSDDEDIFNSLTLPFLNGISNFTDLMQKCDNFNSIFTLKVYKIPKTIKLPTLEKYLINKHDRMDLIKFYKITSTFVKQIKSNYNRTKYKKISDESLINFFGKSSTKRTNKKKNNFLKKSLTKRLDDDFDKTTETYFLEKSIQKDNDIDETTETTETTEKDNNFLKKSLTKRLYELDNELE